MSFIENISRRFVFAVLIVIVVIPLLFPFPLPVPVGQHARNYYNVIKSLEPRSVVLYGLEVSTRDAENYPQEVATLRQLKEQKAVVIFYNFFQTSSMGTIWGYEDAGYLELKYGTDYVHLGFVPGEEATLASFVLDMVGVKPVDHFQNPTTTMPIFQYVHTINDVDLVIGSGGGMPGPNSWAKLVIIPYNKLGLLAVTAGQSTTMYDYLRMGVYKGALLGQRGCVEYETLIGQAGRATQLFAPLYLAHIVLIGLMVATNVAFWYRLSKKGGKQ